jgi:hypothetical protein
MFTDFKVSGDRITCRVTTSKSCTTPSQITSNEIQVVTVQKERTAAILDFSSRNGEVFENNLFSAKHILDVAGIPYVFRAALQPFKIIRLYCVPLGWTVLRLLHLKTV